MQACLCTCTGVVNTTLVSSIKHVKTASCKTCGGRSPVDGIGSISASMISAKGLELTNFINPDLTWKTDSKGYRRTTRRSRKPVDRSPKSDADLTDKGAESPSETTVSESEKLGVAVLGQRFSEKVEHVPIKKRRFTVRSPSPPPCFSSPQVEGNDQCVDGPYSSDQRSRLKLITKKRFIGMDAARKTKNAKHGYDEDFSGIEILAAAACNNNVGDDDNHADDNHAVEESSQEFRDKSMSALPLEECISSKEATHSSPIDTVVEAPRESLDLPEHADETNHNDPSDNPKDADKRTVETSNSSRDVRLHWDLNVEMDAWEQPCDTCTVDFQTNAVEDVKSEKLQVLEACGLQKKSTDVKNNIGTPVSPIIDNEEHKFESNSGIDKNDDKCAHFDEALESSTSPGIVAENSHDVTSDEITNHSSIKESDIIEGSVSSEESKETSFINGAVKQMKEDPSLGAQPRMEEKFEGPDCEVDSTLLNEDGVGSAMVSSLHGDLKSQEILNSDSGSPAVPVKVDEVVTGCTELCSEDVTASGVSLGEGQPIVPVYEEQVAEALIARIDDSKSVPLEFAGNSVPILPTGVESTLQQVSQKCGDNSASSLGRFATEETCDDSHTLDVCDKDHSVGRVNAMDCDKDVGKENTMDFEAGYDSQYEDGELRESDVPYWEDNDCEDGEAERVDYGSDTCDDAGDYSMSSKFGMQVECSEEEFCGTELGSLDRNMKFERVFGPGSISLCDKVEHGGAGDGLSQQSVGPKITTSGSDELPRGSDSSNRNADIPVGCIIRKHNADCLEGFDVKDSPGKVVGSGVSQKELPGVVKSSSSDTLHRSEIIYAERSRSSNFDLCTQPEQPRADHSMGKERSDLQIRCKSPGGYWDSRRRESPTYNGSFGSERPRPKSVIEDRRYAMHPEGAGIAGADNHVHRQANGSYRYPFRRRSPTNRDDGHNMHRGMLPMRESPDRRRFRRYPQGVGRGFREEYHRPLPQNGSEDYPYPVNRMIRREQNSSPPPRGPVYYRRPYKRSQSRSRSRSPGSWMLSREHEVAKHRSSRSPDYRFESRTERMRLPFQKQNFGAKYEMGFMSPPRRRFSPQHNSRWFDDPNGASDHFRGRRLPTRTFQQQGQRFDNVGSSRRLNSDDYYEPTMRPARFSEMGRGGRVRRYDGSDDERRKQHDGRYEIFPRVRRYDSDGVVRRFRYDEEDSFASRNTHNNYNDSDNNNGAERRPRNNGYLGELVKRKVN